MPDNVSQPQTYTAFHASLDVLLDMGEYETVAHLAKSLGMGWETDGYLIEGAGYVSAILDAPETQNLSPALLANLNMIAGNLTRHQSQYQPAEAYYRQGIAQLAPDGDYHITTNILSGLGEIAFRRGDYAAAADYYQQHLAIGQGADNAAKIADALNALGRLATVQHDWSAALEYHDYGHYLSQQHGYQMGIAWSLTARGEWERARNNYRQAAVYYRQSVDGFESAQNAGAHQLAAQNLAFALLALGDVKTAERLFVDVLQFWQKGRALHGMSLCLIGLAGVALAKREAKNAARLLALAERLIRDIGVQLELGDRHDYERTLSQLYDVMSETEYVEIAARIQHDSPQTILADLLQKSSSPALTTREVEVLRRVASGLTDKHIAAELHISPHTVNAHLRSIYRKLDVNTRTAAVSATRQNGLL